MDKIYKITTIAEKGWGIGANAIPKDYYYSDKKVASTIFQGFVNEVRNDAQCRVIKESDVELIYSSDDDKSWHYYIRYKEIEINLDNEFPIIADKSEKTLTYIQIVSHKEPHLTGLVFEVAGKHRFLNCYLVKPILDDTGKQISADMYSKSIAIPIHIDKESADILLKRTKEILEFNNKN